MFRKILVPVDFTDKNEAALRIATESAGPKRGWGEQGAPESSAEVTLLHVVEIIEHIDFQEMESFYRGLEARAAAKMFTLEEPFRAAGVRVRHEVVFGKRAETIVRHAEENGTDLIVLSSHKVDREHPALGWSSISYRIAIVANCPVLLVK